MSDYTKLVEALRMGADYGVEEESVGKLCADAAAAIEELQAEVKRLNMRCADCEYASKPWPELEPKRGKWIRHPEVKNIYGGEYIECPFCGEKYVVQNVSDEKFCRNCGADMRAKMEVQDD